MAPENKQLRITWVKSGIGFKENQKRTLKALGFRKLGESITQKDNPAVRGMIAAVNHLVKVEEVSES